MRSARQTRSRRCRWRTGRRESSTRWGASYDQLKKPKEAAAAYRRSLDIDPDNPDARARSGQRPAGWTTSWMRRLRCSMTLVAADPTDAQSEIRISEIQRRQGHYDEALATLEKAKSQVQDSLELSYNEALIYDALGKYDQATGVLTGILDCVVASRRQVLRAGEAEPRDLPGPAWHHRPRREQDGGGRGGVQADCRPWAAITRSAATMARSTPIATRTSGRTQPPPPPKPRRRCPRTT